MSRDVFLTRALPVLFTIIGYVVIQKDSLLPIQLSTLVGLVAVFMAGMYWNMRV